MTKVRILTTCSHCQGKAQLPSGEAEDYLGNRYIQHKPCPQCEGSGTQAKWISLQEFAALLPQVQCNHEHTSFQGRMRFTANGVWDEIHEVCNDCGATIDRQTLRDYIVEE
jgi:hypothetical protein